MYIYIYMNIHTYIHTQVKEAEYNIKMFKRLWHKAETLRQKGMDDVMKRQDALAALELVTDNLD